MKNDTQSTHKDFLIPVPYKGSHYKIFVSVSLQFLSNVQEEKYKLGAVWAKWNNVCVALLLLQQYDSTGRFHTSVELKKWVTETYPSTFLYPLLWHVSKTLPDCLYKCTENEVKAYDWLFLPSTLNSHSH